MSRSFTILRVRVARAALAGLVISLAGCSPSGGRWTQDDYHLAYGPPFVDRETLSDPLFGKNGEAQPQAELVPLSTPILIIADNQRHELLGAGIPGYRNAVSDDLVWVAIRPPQLDLFGQEIMGEVLDRTEDFVLHLGDACDLSNTLEFARFAWDMRIAPRGWIMTPGNHDGFFVGNVSRISKSWVAEWDATGESYEEDGAIITSTAMQKDRFVSFYLAALILQDQAWSGHLARRLAPNAAEVFASWQAVADPSFATFWEHLNALEKIAYRSTVDSADGPTHYFDLSDQARLGDAVTLRRVVWNIDADKPWRSYVTQEIDISAPESTEHPISILALDTAQYYFLPAMESAFFTGLARILTLGIYDLQLAGTHGNVLETQAEAAEWFMEGMTTEGRRWIVASHHPYGVLGRVSPPRFDAIRSAGGIPVTLSAHTHTGDIRWHHDPKHEGAWLEINVGSLLDAPAEYRDFQVLRVGDQLVIDSQRFKVRDLLRANGLLEDGLSGHRPSPGDPDSYLNYQEWATLSEVETERAVKRVLLAAYLRMFRLFATDTAANVAWPVRLDGTELASDTAVLDEIVRQLQQREEADLDEITHLLYALREFDRTRPVPTDLQKPLKAYRFSQAIWSAEAERTADTIKPPQVDPDISFVLLPQFPEHEDNSD